MNASSVRPHTKFAAAMVAAGMVSAASIVGVPQHQGLPTINVDVANASAITDLFYGIGDAVNAAASGVAYAFDGAFSLPFDGLAAIAVAAQRPDLGPNVLSWLVQRYVNPADSYPLWTYPWAIKAGTIEPLADLLPNGAWIVDGLNTISNVINNAFAGLANPAIGESAATAFWGSDLGKVTLAANYTLTAPVWALYNTAYYLGYLPADLEATFESALRNPSQIPGLVSNLVYDLLSPDYGLLGSLIDNFTLPLRVLPGPIGELATAAVEGLAAGINNLLSVLPAPVSPNPFPSFQSTQAPEQRIDVSSVPEPSLAVSGGISLLSTEVEKKVEAPDSTLEAPQPPQTEASPAAPQDPAPAAADGDAGGTPPAETDTPEVKPGKPLTNRVKLGNKVRPGDTFTGPTKGDTVKDNDTTAPAPEKDGQSDPTGPTGPEGPNTDGADNAGAASNDSGAAA